MIILKKFHTQIVSSLIFLALALYGYYDASRTTASYLVAFFQMLLVAALFLHIYTKNNKASLLLLGSSIPMLAVYSFVTRVSPLQYGVALLGVSVFYYLLLRLYYIFFANASKRYKRYIPILIGVLFVIPVISPFVFLTPPILGVVDVRTVVYALGIFVGIRLLPPFVQKHSQKVGLLTRFPNLIVPALFVLVVLWSGVVILLPNRTIIDVSTHQSFTLSGKTKKIIRDMSQNVEIRIYLSENTPEKMYPISLYATTLIEQYENIGNRKIQVTYIDPENSQTQNYLADHDVSPIRYTEQNGGKEVTRDFYLAAELYTPSKSIFIPQLLKTQTLEYQLTSALRDLVVEEQTIALVGFPQDLTSKGSIMYPFYSLLRQRYHVDELTHADSLNEYRFILGLNLANLQVEQLASNANEKATAVIFQEAVHVSAREGNGLQADTSLASQSAILSDYGISIRPELVLSKSSDTIAFANSGGSFYVQYPFAVRTDTISNSALADTISQSLVFPWTSRLTITSSKRAGWKSYPLVLSEKQSWIQAEPFTLFPSDILMPPGESQQEEVIGAYTTNGNKTIVVIPTTYFLQAPFIGVNSGNYDFVLSLLDQFANDETASSIAAKDLSETAFSGFAGSSLGFFILTLLFGTVIPWRAKHS